MSNTIRIALPDPNNPGKTYDALTDTNLDHFALYTDQDNVLIKEFKRGTVTLASGANIDITHNLGYIPFFLVYVNDTSLASGRWVQVGIPVISGNYFAGATTTIVNIFNNSGSSLTFKYFIFYDNQVGSSGITLTESDRALKIAKAGFNAKTEKDPNNLIFHSDLNTFKLVHQETLDLAIVTTSANYQFAHHSPLTNTSCLLLFGKWPDGKVNNITPQTSQIYSYDENRSLNAISFDSTNIYINYGGVSSNFTFHLAWFIFEPPLP